MSDMDFGTAEELLAAAIEQDSQPNTPDTTSSEPQADEPTEPVVETTADEPFTNIDPNELPDELKQIYKSMQGDFTRKTQEIAEWRKLGQSYEGMTPEQAQQALEFTVRLQNDPQFAQEVYQGLGQALNTDVGNEGQNEPDYDDTEWDDPRDKVIDELLEWKNQQMEEQAYNQRLNELMRQEQTIRQQHPEYTDDDLESIAALAHSYEADLIKATDAYESLRQRLISGYAATKAQVPKGEPSSTQTGAIPPEPAHTLDEAYKMAMEHIANLDQ